MLTKWTFYYLSYEYDEQISIERLVCIPLSAT